MSGRKNAWKMAVVLGLAGALVSPVLADTKNAKEEQSPVEAVRQALDKTITLDFTSQTLQEALQHLREKTKINFVLDVVSLQQMGILLDENPTQVHLKVDKGKVKQGLQRILHPYNLTYVILGDTVVVTTEEVGLFRQMRQRVSLDVENVPLTTVLKKISRSYGIGMVIDPKIAKEAQGPVTLQLEDATLETTVRLLAEVGGLKSVRLGNVLFITSETKAEKLRQEERSNPMNPMYGGLPPGGAIGFGRVPPGIPVFPPGRPNVPPPGKVQPDGVVIPPRPVQPTPPVPPPPATQTVPGFPGQAPPPALDPSRR